MTKDTKIYSFNKMFIRTFSVIFALMFLLLIVYMGIASAFFIKQTNETVASTLKLYNYSLQMSINATTTYQKELAYSFSPQCGAGYPNTSRITCINK